MNNTVEVTTKEELKQAIESKAYEIIIKGELADKLKKTKKVALMSGVGLAALIAVAGVATVAAPETGGLSLLAAAPIAAMSGIEIAAIILAISLGLALIIAVFKDYDEISYKEGELRMKKTRK